MSITHSIDIILDMEYSRENIEKIIKKGEELDYFYFTGLNQRLVNVNDAVHEAINTEADPENIYFLTANVKNIYLDVFFHKTENKLLNLSMYTAGHRWEHCFEYEETARFDFVRYLDEILLLLKPFRIVNLTFETY